MATGKTNWAVLETGTNFEALVGALIRRRSPRAQPYPAPGRDGGLDVRDPSDQSIFQAKFHREGTASKVLTDAKTELQSIQKRLGNPDDAYHATWKSTKTWRLVTNVEMSPQLKAAWEKDIEPLFKAEGLDAVLITGDEVEKWLVDQPDVREHFFGNARNIFGAPEEFISEVDFTLQLQGRETALEAIRTAIEEQLGKQPGQRKPVIIRTEPKAGTTRVLYAATETLRTEGRTKAVRWAHEHAAQSEGNWHRTQENDELIVFDCPRNADLIRRIGEEAADPVHRSVFVLAVEPGWAGGLPRPDVTLSPLAEEDAAKLANELAARLVPGISVDKPRVANWLVTASGRLPGWEVALFSMLASGRGHEEVVLGYRDQYLPLVDALVNELREKKDEGREVLQWVSAAQQVDRKSQLDMKELAELSGLSAHVIEECIARLAQAGAIRTRGEERRLVDVRRPGRDAILMAWLTYAGDTGRAPNGVAKELAGTLAQRLALGLLGRVGAACLESLLGVAAACTNGLDAVTEPIGNCFKEEASKPGPVQQRLDIMRSAAALASLRPSALLATLQELLRVEAIPETIQFGSRSVSVDQSAVLAAMPAAVRNAARGARTKEEKESVLHLLRNLVENEGQLTRETRLVVPNPISPASALEDVITATVTDEYSFIEIAHKQAVALIEATGAGMPSPEASPVWARALLVPQLALQHTEVVSGPAGTVHFIQTAGLRDPRAAARRRTLREKLWAALETALPDRIPLLLELLAKSHEAALQSAIRRPGRIEAGSFRDELKDDLSRMKKWLGDAPRGLPWIKAAMELWWWHRDHDEDPEFKALALSCQEAYTQAVALAPTSKAARSRHEDWKEAVEKDVETLSRMNAAGDVLEFYRRTYQALGKEEPQLGFDEVAFRYGQHASLDGVRSAVLEEALSSKEDHIRHMGLKVLAGHLHARRVEKRALAESINKYAPTDARTSIVLHVYAGAGQLVMNEMGDQDLELVKGELEKAGHKATELEVAAAAALLTVFPADVMNLMKGLVGRQPFSRRGFLVTRLIDRIRWQEATLAPHAICMVDGLLALFELVPSLRDIGDAAWWEAAHMCRKWDIRKPLPQLIPFLEARYALLETMRTSELDRDVPELERRLWSWIGALGYLLQMYEEFDENNPEHVKVIETLVAWLHERDGATYFLPPLKAALDRGGAVVAAKVGLALDMLGGSPAIQDFATYAAAAGAFVEGADAWRKISDRVLLRAEALYDGEDLERIYLMICFHGVQGGARKRGKVPAYIVLAQKEAAEHAEREQAAGAPHLARFWRWRAGTRQAEAKQVAAHIEETDDE